MKNDDAPTTTVIAPYVSLPGGLLPALRALQIAHGYIEEDAIPQIADAFNLSRAEVHGVISFYHDFRRARPGRHVIKICQAEACQAMNARELTEHARARLGLNLHETDSAGRITLEPVYCLGNCACSPAIMIDDKAYGRVTNERFDELVDALAGNK